jgi:hypothetical protein
VTKRYPHLNMVVVDNGLFSALAERLSRDVGRLILFIPWVSSFPTSHLAKIGTGIEGVTRITEFFTVVDEAMDDPENWIFVFLDIHFADWQLHLRKLGLKVFGAAQGEDLECFRWDAKLIQQSVGLPVGDSALIVGLDNLREYLQKNDGVHVKVSKYRGITETFESINYRLAKARLDALQHDLGPLADEQEFIVEKKIKSPVENGGDFIIVDGKSPDIGFVGIESKDCGYIMAAIPYSEIAPQVRNVNDKLAAIFKAYGYRGFYSSEIRKDVLIDSTTRCPSPPIECMQEMIVNLCEVIVNGASGVLIQLEIEKPYGFEFMLYSDFATEDPLAVEYPAEIARNVKLYNSLRRKGLDWVMPTDGKLVQIGAVTGFGDTIKEAEDQAQEHAEMVKGDGISVKPDLIPKLNQQLRESVKRGVSFGKSPIPD